MIIVDLRYYLSKDNNNNKFGPPVRQIWSFENGRSSPFWPTFPKIAGRRTKTVVRWDWKLKCRPQLPYTPNMSRFEGAQVYISSWVTLFTAQCRFYTGFLVSHGIPLQKSFWPCSTHIYSFSCFTSWFIFSKPLIICSAILDTSVQCYLPSGENWSLSPLF